MLRKYGSNKTWPTAQSWLVRSQPSEQCTKTEAPSVSTIETMHIAATNTLRKCRSHSDPATVDQNGSTDIISVYSDPLPFPLPLAVAPPFPFTVPSAPFVAGAAFDGTEFVGDTEPDADPLDIVRCPIPKCPVLFGLDIVAEPLPFSVVNASSCCFSS